MPLHNLGQQKLLTILVCLQVITVDTADGERSVSHFILGSGSILGLYEALAGNRAKLTSAVADSVSLCYVLDVSSLSVVLATVYTRVIWAVQPVGQQAK